MVTRAVTGLAEGELIEHLRAAVDAGDVIGFEPGTYDVSGALHLRSGVTLQGAAGMPTTFKWRGNSTEHAAGGGGGPGGAVPGVRF